MVLDKGFVAPLEFSGNGRLLQDLQDTYFRTRTNIQLLDLASATFVMKCPLFVQLNLCRHGLNVITTPSDSVEAYVPDLSMVEGDSLEDRKRLTQYIKATTESLLLNHKSIPMDGGSEFTAQLVTPISVYNELIVSGPLQKWLSFVKQNNLPKELELYRQAIRELLLTEWKNLDKLEKIL
jgi:hypothetical protein